MSIRKGFVAIVAVSSLTLAGAFAADPLHPSYKGATWKGDMARDFKAMDANADKKVDMAEWQAHKNPLHPEYAKDHAKPGQLRLSAQEMDEVWKKISDGGVVSMGEWVSHRNPLHPQYEAKHPLPGEKQTN